MTKKISFNAFEMNCIAHQSPGLWRHPQDRSVEYKGRVKLEVRHKPPN